MITQFVQATLLGSLLRGLFTQMMRQQATLTADRRQPRVSVRKVEPQGIQAENLDKARVLARKVTGRRVPVYAAEFPDGSIGGAYDGWAIYIGTWRLTSWDWTKGTLAHELAHYKSRLGDENPRFVDAMAKTAADIIRTESAIPQITSAQRDQLAGLYGKMAVEFAENIYPIGGFTSIDVIASSIAQELTRR